jgi:DNA-binding SARP family transcriptional activator
VTVGTIGRVGEGDLSDIRFAALGTLEVSVGDTAVPIGGPKQRSLLGALLLRANSVVPAERLVEDLWGREPSETSRSTLQVHVSNLRKVLSAAQVEAAASPDEERATSPGSVDGHHDPALISSISGGYRIQLRSEQLDILEFDALVDRARSMRNDGEGPQEVASVLRRALALWRGSLLADVPAMDLVRDHATVLDGRRAAAVAGLAELELELGQHALTVDHLEGAVREWPYDERIRGLLMVALYRTGRQADALAVCRRGRALLVEELGVEPGPELAELELRILEHDPALRAPRSVVRIHGADGTDLQDDNPPSERTTVGRLTVAVLDVGGFPRPISLHRAVTTIGRTLGCVLTLSDPMVSRLHAEIRRLGETFVLVDSGSTHGTCCNGELISRTELNDGDVIELGGSRMVFQLRTGPTDQQPL